MKDKIFDIKRFIMVTITKWGSKELEIGTELDHEEELEVKILNSEGYDTFVWLKKEEVKRLIEHLQTAVISSAYWVELNGGNILIVVADSVGDACDKLDKMNFENYSIKHEKTMVALS